MSSSHARKRCRQALRLLGVVWLGAVIGCQSWGWGTSGARTREKKPESYDIEEILEGEPATYPDMLDEARSLRETAYTIEHAATPDPAEAEKRKDDAAKVYARAQHWLDKAIAMKPDKPDAYHQLGNLRAKQGIYEAAIKAFQEAVKRDPKFYKSHYGMGWSTFKQADLAKEDGVRKAKYAEATQHWTKALAGGPRVAASAQYNLGVIAHRQERWPDAKTHYRAALKLNPRHANARLNLGLILATQDGDLAGGLKLWEAIIGDYPAHIRAQYNLARAAIEDKQWRDAETHWLLATNGEPSDVDEQHLISQAWYRLAILYEDKLENIQKSKEAIRQACRIEPRNKEYRQFLRRVERKILMQGG